jgi:two-component system cell cycle response regulator CtrA
MGDATPRTLIDALDKRAVAVDVARTVEDAFAILTQYACDALVIFAASGVASSLPFVRKARMKDARLPILVYGGNTAADRVSCFDGGADEVVPGDCEPAELMARLHAIVRRSKGHSSPCVSVGNLCLDVNGACVRVSGRKLMLTRKEFRMLEMLVVGAGTSISKVKLLDALYFGQEERDESIIGVFLCMLRKKLREAGAEVEIETFRGIGYSLRPRADSERDRDDARASNPARGDRPSGRPALPAAAQGYLQSVRAAFSQAGAEWQPSAG